MTPMVVALTVCVALAFRHRESRWVVATMVGGFLATLGATRSVVQRRIDAEHPTALTSGVPQSIWWRWRVWTDDYLPLLGRDRNWLGGWGTGVPSSVAYPYTESVYVALLVRGGVIGLALFLALIAAGAMTAWRSTARVDAVERLLGLFVLGTTVVVLICGFVEQIFLDVGAPHLYWVGLGLLAGRATQTIPPLRGVG